MAFVMTGWKNFAHFTHNGHQAPPPITNHVYTPATVELLKEAGVNVGNSNVCVCVCVMHVIKVSGVQ